MAIIAWLIAVLFRPIPGTEDWGFGAWLVAFLICLNMEF